jgi:hypothetical protein
MHAVQGTVVIKSMADWAKKKLASKHHPKKFGLPQVWVHLLPGSFLAQGKIVCQLNRLEIMLHTFAHSYLVQALERNLHISTSGLVQLIFKPLNSLGLEINRTSPQESSRDNLEKKNIHFAISNSYP